MLLHYLVNVNVNVRHFIHKMANVDVDIVQRPRSNFYFFYLRHFNIDRFTPHYSIVTIDSVASSHPVYSAKKLVRYMK